MYTHRPRKRFGQHFLRDRQVIDRIITAIDPRPDQTLIEIGPGEGALTKQLVQRVDHLHVIEIDRDLATRLPEVVQDPGKMTIHCVDALEFDITDISGANKRIVGNLPYNISTPLLFHLLEHPATIRDMIFMMQKEVVDRLVAAPGSRSYGRLSVMVQSTCRIDKLFEVGPGAFSPPPKVKSAVVRITPVAELAQRISNQDLLARLVLEAFNQRRKTLRNALRKFINTEQLQALGIDPSLRPENLMVEQFITLANHCHEAGNQ